jgi:hypothetical protein
MNQVRQYTNYLRNKRCSPTLQPNDAVTATCNSLDKASLVYIMKFQDISQHINHLATIGC